MARYMLLLHDDPSAGGPLSPDQIQAVIAEYVAWSDKLAANNQLLGGDKLTNEGGRVLKINGGDVVTSDGPYAEAKEVLGGYYAIEAPNYGEAVKIASTCPHLHYGSRIEVREIEELGD